MTLNAEPTTRRWLPSHGYANHEDAVARLAVLIDCYTTPGHPRQGPYVMAIEHGNTGRLLGHVGFSPFHEDVEISYAIAEASRGRGYATEALILACNWIADTYAVPSILALTATENIPSRRTLERASFGQIEDDVMTFQATTQTVSRYRWSARTDIGGDQRRP